MAAPAFSTLKTEAADSALNLLYGGHSTKQLFGDLTGKELVEKVFSVYKVDQKTLPFFDSSGSKRLLVRHEGNSRNQAQVRAKYKQSILRHGIIEGVRGQPWAVKPEEPTMPFRLITFGTITKSF